MKKQFSTKTKTKMETHFSTKTKTRLKIQNLD